MVQPSKTLGVFLCDQVIFERGSQKPSLIGCFAGMAVSGFPPGPQRFDVFAALADGLGDVIIELAATHLETEQEIYARRASLRFPDPLQIVHFRYRVFDCDFPAPGAYLFALFAGEAEIAACRVYVYERVYP